MNPTDAEEHVDVWANVASPTAWENSNSVGRAVLWLLDSPDSPVIPSASKTSVTLAHLRSQGIAQVSLVSGTHETGETYGKWVPSHFRVVSTSERESLASNELADFITPTTTTPGKEIDGCRRALLSHVLAETLGLHIDRRRTIRILVRKLQCMGHATAVELCGPYPLLAESPELHKAAISSALTSNVSNGPPPPSVMGAISSILSGDLEDENISPGSILIVAGMFKVIVVAVWVDSSGGSSSERGGVHRLSDDAVVRVTNASHMRLLPPRRNRYPQDYSSAKTYRPYQCQLSAQSELQRSTEDSILKDASSSEVQAVRWRIAPSEKNRAQTSTSKPPPWHIAPVSLPAYASHDTSEWMRQVQQDFGGEVIQVAAAVRATGAALKTCISHHEDSSWLGSPAGGVLLHGPTGAGKTLLARSVAMHSGAPWFFLDCSSVFRKERGKAERLVQELLEEAHGCSPSIVVLDQVESVCRRRPESAGITELQIFSILLEAMDRWRHLSGLRVFFLATCPDSTALDPSLLQTGRLGVVLRLGSLDVSSRAAILGVHARAIPLRFHVPAVNAEASSTQEKLSGEGNEARSSSESSPADLPGVYAKGNSENVLEWEREPSPPTIGVGRALDVLRVTACLPQTRDEFLRLIAARCHGYLGSDLERLCREAAMIHISTGAGASPVHYSGLSNADTAVGFHHGVTSGADPVALEDFWEALDVVRPASLVGHSIGLSSTDADSKGASKAILVGCEVAMAELRSYLLVPLANPALLRGLGLRAASGALLHGPSGCGKTSVARALATEAMGIANFLEVRCSDLVDKVVGRSEKSVSDLFAAARAAAPCILFLDQVEGVAARRGYHSSTEQTFDRILSTLLVEMDGVMSESAGQVVVLAATNDISRLDPALLRPGRLDRRVYLGPPDMVARTAIFEQRLSSMPIFEGRINVGATSDGGRANEDTSFTEDAELGSASGSRKLDSVDACAAWLAEKTEGCSGAQVTGICREAALAALRENISACMISPRHFESALHSVRR